MTKQLEALREKINLIDAEIIEKLAERQRLVKQIGEIKSQYGQAVLDTSREAQLFEYYKTLCEQHQLDPVFVRQLFEIVFVYSRELQK